MGLFDKLGGGGEIKLSQQGAFLLSAMTMIGIDGDIDDDEVAIIQRMDRGNRSKDWDSAYKAWRKKSISECVEIVAKTIGDSGKNTVITNLIDIAMADAVLEGDERKLLEQYVEALNVDISYVEKAVDVISIKNKVFF